MHGINERKNHMSLKQTLLSGEKIHGCMLRIVRNPAIWLMARDAGLDWAMLDCEHGNYDFETLHDMFVMAQAVGMEGFVRVPVGTKEWISRVLDAGATGVMVPMVETKEYAQEIAGFAKYTPIGKRGFVGMSAHNNYHAGKPQDIMTAQNDSVLAIVQIETKKAVDNVDEIASVNGVDVLFVGPADLSISLGIPGDLTNPIELEAIRKVAAACRRHGKYLGLLGNLDLLEHFREDLNMVMVSDDANMLIAGLAKTMEVHKKIH
jgi:2-keto-3-deoxy-L-rhamnonate aldolase RhmA